MVVINLYGGWDCSLEDSKPFLVHVLENGDFAYAYKLVQEDELEAKNILLEFEKDYPKVATASNVYDILKSLKSKRYSDNK